MVIRKCVEDCIELVRDRLGIEIPESIFKEDTSFFTGDLLFTGVYYDKDTNCIYLNPRMLDYNRFEVEEEVPLYKEILIKNIKKNYPENEWDARIAKIDDVEAERKLDLHYLYCVYFDKDMVLHEIGHYVHHNYFADKDFHINTEHSIMPTYKYNNVYENFAYGFREYIGDDLPKDSIRYNYLDFIFRISLRNSPNCRTVAG